MVIRAGGHDWVVEARKRDQRIDETGFVDVRFQRVDAEDDDALELGWAPVDGGLSDEAARVLFQLAGRRRWRDPRSGRRWSVELSPTGSDEELAGPIRVRFLQPGRPDVSTVYPLARPLGLATAPELQAMLDVALETSVSSGGFTGPRSSSRRSTPAR